LDSVQKLLSQAIVELTSDSGAGPRAGADLVFNPAGDQSVAAERAKWIKAAWTLKARFYMHTAESLGVPAYNNAIAAALNGISDASGNSDFRAFHSGLGAGERNMWGAFQESSSFGQDVVPGQFLDTLMKRRDDPRLPAYFCELTNKWKASPAPPAKPVKHKPGDLINDPNHNLQKVTAVTGDSSSGTVQPTWATALNATTTDNNVTWTNVGLPWVGQDFNSPRANTSTFACQPSRFADTYRMPFASYAENELILAEAYRATGNDALALTHLNNERTYVNATYPATVGPPATTALPTLVGITSATGLLDSIMTEKYVAMFQNMETINDYRRTCIPAVTVVTNSQGFSNVPGRLYYPRTERNVNTNIPDPSAQLSAAGHYFRNAGDVAACTVQNAP
jgi:hypothetical protein